MAASEASAALAVAVAALAEGARERSTTTSSCRRRRRRARKACSISRETARPYSCSRHHHPPCTSLSFRAEAAPAAPAAAAGHIKLSFFFLLVVVLALFATLTAVAPNPVLAAGGGGGSSNSEGVRKTGDKVTVGSSQVTLGRPLKPGKVFAAKDSRGKDVIYKKAVDEARPDGVAATHAAGQLISHAGKETVQKKVGKEGLNEYLARKQAKPGLGLFKPKSADIIKQVNAQQKKTGYTHNDMQPANIRVSRNLLGKPKYKLVDWELGKTRATSNIKTPFQKKDAEGFQKWGEKEIKTACSQYGFKFRAAGGGGRLFRRAGGSCASTSTGGAGAKAGGVAGGKTTGAKQQNGGAGPKGAGGTKAATGGTASSSKPQLAVQKKQQPAEGKKQPVTQKLPPAAAQKLQQKAPATAATKPAGGTKGKK
ncbi:hypothetical protein DFJ73DRAFT_935586 [Zopfochytrium polystomum]|nr:hypothetical protein DFJ73DRAFT_935586 [Zopfochytrium polystomum]